jgi:DNA-binding MarR family transcriptional regulator
MSIKDMSIRSHSKPRDDAPPPRAAKRPAAVPGRDAEVNRFLAAYIMGVANRLANGASQHYRSRFNLGMSEWRTLMAIGTSHHRIVRDVAQMADLDYALVSKSLKALQGRGLVAIEQTQTRGRAAIASLTPEGLALYKQLRASAQRRQRRLLAAFTPAEVQTLWSLLQRVEAQVPSMNAEPGRGD